MKKTSQSSRMYEFLIEKDRGFRFSFRDLINLHPSHTSGGATGYLSKALKAGAIDIVGKKDGCRIYSIIDLDLYPTRKSSSLGSNPGRLIKSHSEKNYEIPDLGEEGIESKIDSLSSLITDLIREELVSMVSEAIKQNFSDELLLKELKDRLRGK